MNEDISPFDPSRSDHVSIAVAFKPRNTTSGKRRVASATPEPPTVMHRYATPAILAAIRGLKAHGYFRLSLRETVNPHSTAVPPSR